MKRRILAGITAFLYNFFILSPGIIQIFAAAQFELVDFYVAKNGGSSYTTGLKANPGDELALYVYGINNWTTLNNLATQFTFSSNDFTFTNAGSVDLRSQENVSTILKSSIPAWDFNPPVDNIGPVADVATNGNIYDFGKVKIQINSTFSSPVFTISNKFFADGYAGSNEIARVIAINVRPHIIDYYFEKADGSQTTSQIQWSNAEGVNLVLKVRDYNGCSNMTAGSVTADLAQIGLTATTPLDFVSCEADGKTAIYKKMEITTETTLGTKVFSATAFFAQDANGNRNDITDANFAAEDKKDNLFLEVVPATSATVTISSLSDPKIGGPAQPSSVLTFSANQNGSYKVAAGSNGSCDGGTIIQDWTASGSYLSGTSVPVTVLSSSLATGNNNIFVCVKNPIGTVGSANVVLEKDTAAPAISAMTASPSSVVTENIAFSFQCSESGSYQVEVGGSGTLGSGVNIIGATNITANTLATVSIPNASLLAGTWYVWAFCTDEASNIASSSIEVYKTPTTPSMDTRVTSLTDSDIDYDDLDGRDMTIVWDNTDAVSFPYFESYRVYILPAAVDFDPTTQAFTKLLTNKALTGITLNESVVRDSTSSVLVSGWSYKACVAVMGTSGKLGTGGCSPAAILTADTVSHPTVLSAKFVANTSLEITTNATLSTTLADHSGTLVSYQIGATTYTGAAISAVSGKKLTVTIPALGNLGATGSALTIQTGAIRANGGGFNNYFTSGALTITDGQIPPTPTITLNTASPYNSFYKGNIVFGYTFSERMSTGTYLEITPTGGNADTQGVRTRGLTLLSDNTSGAHTYTLNLASLTSTLVSGTTYRVRMIASDLGGNNVFSNYIENIKYDAVGPTAPNVPNLIVFGITNPTLSWLASVDNSWNGSGIKQYVLKVYSGNNICSTAGATYTLSGTILSYQLLGLITGAYSWNIYAIDNLDNVGTTSSCDDFAVDTAIPSITSAQVVDTTSSSTQYTQNGRVLQVKATIPNTNSAHIWANLSALTGVWWDNSVLCSAPTAGITCSYASNVVTYTLTANSSVDGVRSVSFSAQNAAGANDQTASTSITVDNTAPQITGGITSPVGGEVWGGTSKTITWAGISDNIAIKHLLFEYYNGTSWNTIGTGANVGSLVWDISGLSSGANYQVRITAYDHLNHTAQTTSPAVFSIDKIAPTNPAGTLLTPSGSTIVKGGTVMNITWNSAAITDASGLPAQPIKIEYSTNGGTSWTALVNATQNDGTHSWTVPNINTSAGKMRITATDLAGNSLSSLSTGTFIVDSSAPTLTLTYAGAGGTIPQDGKKINSTGIDISGNTLDPYLATVSYLFKNATTGLYWNGASYVGSPTWVVFCTDTQTLGNAGVCNNIANTTALAAPVVNGNSYIFQLRSTDEAGNMTTSNAIGYGGDTINPTLTINTADNQFVDGTMTLSGVASDAGSSISSVQIQLTKYVGPTLYYWNWADWTTSSQSLPTTTSDSYAHWSYSLPLTGDGDGQSYTGTVIAYDKAFKVNNSSQSVIHFTRDASAPVVASDVFTFATAGYHTDGEMFEITWDPAKITATGAALAANPISLFYNIWAGPVAIPWAANIANNGSFTFALPVADTDNARFIITAKDVLGHESVGTLSSPIKIDSTPPTIVSVQTRGDTLGKIDGLIVHMSEEINIASINIANFSVANIPLSATYTTSNAGTGTAIELNFVTATGTTASTPTLVYTKGSLVDLAGKYLASASVASTDKAEPRLANSALIYDTNANGKVDQIRVSFSENLAATTDIASWTLNNALLGSSIVAASTSGTAAILTLSEPTDFNTSTGGMTLSFVNNGSWKDSANNTAANSASPQILTDKAAPVVVSKTTEDQTQNFKMDAIKLALSEDITGTQSGFIVTNLAAGAAYAGTMQISPRTLRLIVSETSADNDTAQIPSIAYAGTYLGDAAGNVLAPISTVVVADGIAPKVLSRQTRDANGNGILDSILITTSEALNDSFAGMSTSVAGYVVNSITTLTGADSQFAIWVDETTTINTSVTPAVQILSNATLGDASSNFIFTDTSSVASVDGIGPVITGARYDESNKTIYATFSENVTNVLGTSSFQFSGIGWAYGVDSVSFTLNSATAQIVLNGSPSVTYGTSTISFAPNIAADAAGNKQSGTLAAPMVASVIINEVMFSTTSANQYIELRNLSNSAVSLSGWTIANAGVTLPAGASIDANGYYLIAKDTEANSILSVVPNLVAPALSLDSTTQASLVLQSGATPIDSAKANPWPAGSGSVNISMERTVNPGNGLLPASWYEAQVSVGFDTLVPRGTPKTVNQTDAFAPNITNAYPQTGVLYAKSPSKIAYEYADVGTSGINTSSANLILKKWNGTAYDDVTGVSLGAPTVTASSTTYPLNLLAFGKYQATFTIKDSANNETQEVTEFYVDKVELSVDTSSIHIGDISPELLVTSSVSTTITLKTLWAGAHLSLVDENGLFAGIHQINSWSGAYGFGVDVAKSGDQPNTAFDSVIESASGIVLLSQAYSSWAIDPNGNQKTYVFTLKFASKVDALKVSALYSWVVTPALKFSY